MVTKSTNYQTHIQENVRTVLFNMEKDNHIKLDKIRREEFDEIRIDWEFNSIASVI